MAAPPNGREGEHGLTMLEVVIASAILLAIMGATFSVVSGAQRQLGTASAIGASDSRAAAIARLIEARIRDGGTAMLRKGDGTIFSDPETSPSGMRIRRVVGFAGVLIYGEGVGFSLRKGEAFDGVDNDKDNVVDEFGLYLDLWPVTNTPADQTQLLAAPASSTLFADNIRSLQIRRTGKLLVVTVVAEQFVGPSRQLHSSTGTVTLDLRN